MISCRLRWLVPDQPPAAALGELRAQVAELLTANARLHEVIEAKGAQLAAAQAAVVGQPV